MNKPILILLLSILISGTAQATPFLGSVEAGHLVTERGGIIVGNGGFSVRCAENAPLLSYDFLASQNEMGNDFIIHPENDATKSLQRIRALISTKLPALKHSFDEFISEIGHEDSSKQYIWQINAPWYITSGNYPTEPFLSFDFQLCPNLQGPYFELGQVVLRSPVPSSDGKKIIFYYDPDLFYQLTGVQRSFLLVHEWLWDFADNLTSNRNANYFLHSVRIEKMSSEAVIQEFKALGIDYP